MTQTALSDTQPTDYQLCVPPLPPQTFAPGGQPPAWPQEKSSNAALSQPCEQVSLFGMKIDRVRMPQAVDTLLRWISQPDGTCRYVVTPNVDHAVLFQEQPELRRAYADAGLVLADGHPVVWASRLLRRSLPERVAGSDLVPALFQASSNRARPLTVFLLGAMPGVGDRAADTVHRTWPHVKVVGTYSPPLGFEKDAAENARILQRIAEVQPDLLVLGLGAPKQELWIHRHFTQMQVPAVLCVGAVIDFLAGEKKRAPVWVRKFGLEWAHRLCTEPKRLWRRYAKDARIFPMLIWREWTGASLR